MRDDLRRREEEWGHQRGIGVNQVRAERERERGWWEDQGERKKGGGV
jgi:hypothetical protein